MSLSLESLYVPINDLVEKDSETVVETLNLTPRERHRGILEQMEEVWSLKLLKVTMDLQFFLENSGEFSVETKSNQATELFKCLQSIF